MVKSKVCSVCKRRFQTAEALQQHSKDAHGSGRASNQLVKRSPSSSAPLSAGYTLRPFASDMASLSGVDRLAHFDDIKDYVSGAVLLNLLVEPNIFPRLSHIASGFQRIKYQRLRFRVVTQVGAQTGGGYVAAMVSDPSDTWLSLDQLTSQHGSVATKWWESSDTAVSSGRDYFTSRGAEIREYSPGRFVLMVEGPATTPGSVTVYCDWTVSMSGPSLEDVKRAARVYYVKRDIWMRDSDTSLSSYDPMTKKYSKSITSIATGLLPGVKVRLGMPVLGSEADDKGTCHPVWFKFAYAKDANSLVPCKTSVDDPLKKGCPGAYEFMVQGSQLIYVEGPLASGGEEDSNEIPATTAAEALVRLSEKVESLMASSMASGPSSSKAPGGHLDP